MAGTRAPLIATTTPSVALYILNNKRPFINDMEARLGLQIMVTGSDKLAGANFTIEKGAAPAQPQRRIERNVVNMESGFEGEEDESGEFEARESRLRPQPRGSRAQRSRTRSRARRSEEGGSRRRRRRRRGGRGGEREEGGSRYADEARGGVEDVGGDEDDTPLANEHGGDEDVQSASTTTSTTRARERHAEGGEGGERTRERGGRSRRRGRRGGRRGRDRNGRAQRRGTRRQRRLGAARIGDEQPAYSIRKRERRRASSRNDRPAPPAHGRAVVRRDALLTATKCFLPRRCTAPSEDTRPAKEVPGASAAEAEQTAARRRAAAAAPASRAWSASSSGRRTQARCDRGCPASGAPARKGWWQRKLGGE